MCFVDVSLTSFGGAEDVCAVVTSVPVTFLLVLQAELAGVAGPSSEAPSYIRFHWHARSCCRDVAGEPLL